VSKRLDAASAAHALEVIERNARVQTGMINDVLDVSRIISGKLSLALRTVDLVDSLQAALDSIAPAAQAKQIEIASELVSPTLVVGDPDRLQQVLWNLLSNAVKFTPDGGRVIVRIATVDNEVGIEVSDNGIGIDPRFLPHVFERFSQADASPTKRHGGLGLGLAIVRHLVELHGGTVKAESRGQGLGATVRVTLPAAPASNRAEQPSASAARPGMGGQLSGLKLLAVDDEPDARDLLLAVLGSQGADVRVAATAEEAMERVLDWRPHLLLTDLGMPVQDGYDLIRAVRTHPDEAVRRLPAIALTAYGREVDKERVLTAGFDRHVSKPVVPEELIAVVGVVLQARL
jgi:CheY-like chemotaxis protein/two-component sensor histidine kinase